MGPLLEYFPGMTIVALYARVSTKDTGQRTEKQLPALRRFAQAWP
jgi:DNA invertase Pin-like site-specific DNA recombinase